MDEGTGNVTSDEVEAAKGRVHDTDKKDFIAAVKKIIKAKNMRINKYIIKELHDSHMLKMEIERFLGGVSMGTRWIKGYLSDVIKKTLMTLIDAIPKKPYIDNRDNTTRYRPEKITRKAKAAPTDIDLDTLWNVKDKG